MVLLLGPAMAARLRVPPPTVHVVLSEYASEREGACFPLPPTGTPSLALFLTSC